MNEHYLNRKGYAVYTSCISPIQITTACEWVTGITDSGQKIPGTLSPEYDTATGKLTKIRDLFWCDSKFWHKWLIESGILDYVLDTIGTGAALIQHISLNKPPRFRTIVPPHQDQALWPCEYPGAIPLWVPLVDTTRENGCLNFWPGSHKLGQLIHSANFGHDKHPGCDISGLPIKPEACPVNAGDMVTWDRFMVHSSGQNLTPYHRPCVIFLFVDTSANGFCSPQYFMLS